MNRNIRICALIALSWFFCQLGFGEEIYDCPYRGQWKPGWSREHAPFDILKLLDRADAVWLGQINLVRTISSEEGKPTKYKVTVAPTKILKGIIGGEQTFDWESWFPHIILGKDMILFTKIEGERTIIFRARTAYYKKKRGISLYDVEDLPTDLIVDILSELLSRKRGEKPNFEVGSRIIKEYESGKWRVDKACVSLAGALGDPVCIQLLKKDVARRLNGQWDYGRFEVSARLLVKLQKADGVRALLNSLVTSGARGSAKMGRMKESYVFFVSATEGGETAIDPIVWFVERHPEYLASAVGALGQIATQPAREILRSWLLERNNWKRTDVIRQSSYDSGLKLPISAFVVRALLRCQDRKAQPLLLRVAEHPEAPKALKQEAIAAAKRLAELEN
ncbi:hypothetical protein ES702_01904 [subsurface metagenome]